MTIRRIIGLALLYPARTELLRSLPSWISPRARSHSPLGPEGHKGHLITNALARPFLHLLNSTRRPRRESQLLHFGMGFSRPLGAPVARAPKGTSGGGDVRRRRSPW